MRFKRQKKEGAGIAPADINVTISFPISNCIGGTLTESFFHNRCCKTCDLKDKKKKGVVSPTMLVEFLHNPVSYDYS